MDKIDLYMSNEHDKIVFFYHVENATNEDLEYLIRYPNYDSTCNYLAILCNSIPGSRGSRLMRMPNQVTKCTCSIVDVKDISTNTDKYQNYRCFPVENVVILLENGDKFMCSNVYNDSLGSYSVSINGIYYAHKVIKKGYFCDIILDEKESATYELMADVITPGLSAKKGDVKTLEGWKDTIRGLLDSDLNDNIKWFKPTYTYSSVLI